MRVWNRVIAGVICGLIVAVAAVRVGALTSGKSFTAPGEREWSAWAWRDGSARPLAQADALLRGDEPVDVVVIGLPFDEVWWRGMAAYYLPSHKIVRVEAADLLPSAGTRTVVVVEKRKLHVIRAR